jgi:hypothetical protein
MGMKGDPPAVWRQLSREMGHSDGYLHDIWGGKKNPDPEKLMALARVTGVSLLVWYRLAGLLPEDLVPRNGEGTWSAETEAMLRDAVEEFGPGGVLEVVEWHRRWRDGALEPKSRAGGRRGGR